MGRVNDPRPLPLLDPTIDPDAVRDGYPFDVPATASVDEIRFEMSVTLFFGENGTGKSTLLEAIAFAVDQVASDGAAQGVHEHVRQTKSVLADPEAFTRRF